MNQEEITSFLPLCVLHRPDWLLGDFIQIFHPDIKGLPPLHYYKKLPQQ